jgi:hypothetical protein
VNISTVAWTACAALFTPLSHAEGPFITTYTSATEELWTLEISAKNLTCAPSGANRFAATALEFEYGATNWWTTEFYLDGQVTANENALFTGFCLNQFQLGLETWYSRGTTIQISPTFGVNHNSAHFQLRFAVSHEVDDFGRAEAKLFHH